jgi:ribosomal-protein-alanine N-acetyltransferase
MMRYISPGTLWDDARINATLDRQARQVAEHDCCFAAATLKETGAVIGVGGIQPLGETGEYEIGWWIWKEYWNRGLASEIAGAAKRHAFESMRLPRVVAIVHPDNTASIRVMQKIGMRYEGLRNARQLAARLQDIDVAYYSLDNPG